MLFTAVASTLNICTDTKKCYMLFIVVHLVFNAHLDIVCNILFRKLYIEIKAF